MASVVRIYKTGAPEVMSIAQPAEYRQRAEDVLAACAAGIIKPSVWKTFALADVSAAHAALEGGKSAGAIVLTP
jgi:NADPH2:quinone reductase